MSNATSKAKVSKQRKEARRLVIEMVDRIGQRPTALRLKVNPGIVYWFKIDNYKGKGETETDRLRWTHITLDELFMMRIETAHAAVMHSAEISAEAMQHADRALELQSELAKEHKALRRELRKL